MASIDRLIRFHSGYILIMWFIYSYAIALFTITAIDIFKIGNEQLCTGSYHIIRTKRQSTLY